MSRLTLITSLTTPDDLGMSRITDLAINPAGGTLYSTTRYDGEKAAWSIAGNQLNKLDQATYASGALAGATPGLVFVSRNGDPTLLSGGGSSNQMSLQVINNNGSLGAAQNLGSASTNAGTLVQPLSVALSGGGTAVYGGVQGGSGVAQMIFAADGSLTHSIIIPDTGSVSARNVTALASTEIAGTQYVFSARSEDLGITAWAVESGGTLKAKDTVSTADGLWINGPSAMVTATVNGESYVILASAGSNSLSVVSVGTDGSLQVVNHIIDDLNTRFDGVTALASVTHQGQSYIIAGGADDGITVFLVRAGGGLLAVDNLADTTAMTLANVSAIAAQSQADGLDIFVASSTEAGLTRLFYNIGQDMDVINGSSGNDTLNAGAGDDVLTDGAGRDTLIGGGGADIFVLAADDQADVITDFEVGVDRIDLSDWNNLRSTSQLFLTTTSYGITITYGNETLNLLSNDGQSISTSDLLETEIVGAARFPAVMVAGTAGPITTPPDLPDRPEADDPTPALVQPYELYEVLGTGANDSLRGSTGDDIVFGQSGNDRLYGDAGNDLLFGGTGSDQLFGGAGNDILYGGGGRDDSWQSLTDAPGTNADKLYGGAGDDTLTGGGGRDTFVFRSGRDTITDFTYDVDLITLDDALWDDAQNIAAVIAQSGSIKAGSASLDFGDGNVLTLTGVTDLAALTSHIDNI